MAENMVTWKFCQNNPKEIPRLVWLGRMIISGPIFGHPFWVTRFSLWLGWMRLLLEGVEEVVLRK